MKKDIYNKNAREAHLMAEAYNNIYNEDDNKEDKDFRDEQRDQDPHRHKGLSDFDAEQRDQDPLRHSGDLKKLTYSVGSVGGQHGQIMHRGKTFDSLEDACNHAGVDVSECIAGEWDDMGDGTKEYGVDEDTVIVMHINSEDNEYDEDGEDKIFGLVDKDGKIVSLYDNEGVMRQVMASSPDLKAVPLDELPFNTDVSSEDGEHTEYDSEADAYRAMSDGYKAEDSVKVGNIYKGESYYELVIGIKGNEVFTKKIDLEDGNRYDIKQMHKELSSAGNIDFEFLNEIM